jgi:transposase-like protein
MNICPKCAEKTRQSRSGFNRSGSQRYQCRDCGKKYTPSPKEKGHSQEIRTKAIRMYVDGLNFRRIGRLLNVHHQSVINWVNAYASSLPEAPTPAEVDEVEMDELYTFVGEKKTEST